MRLAVWFFEPLSFRTAPGKEEKDWQGGEESRDERLDELEHAPLEVIVRWLARQLMFGCLVHLSAGHHLNSACCRLFSKSWGAAYKDNALVLPSAQHIVNREIFVCAAISCVFSRPPSRWSPGNKTELRHFKAQVVESDRSRRWLCHQVC